MKHFVTKIVSEIQKIYLLDSRPLSLGFSGGKDSTVIVDLVFKALLEIPKEQRIKKVYLLHSNTKLEFDPLVNLTDKTFENIEKFIQKHKLPIEIKRVEPETKNTFFSLLFGKGYTLPTRNNRWCTSRLKTDIMDRAIQEILKKEEGFIAVTGQRRDESIDRKKRLADATIKGEVLKVHDRKECALYTPIEFWSEDDVWSYIFTESSEWVEKIGLGKIYADASVNDGDECRTLLEGISGEQAGCSQSSRYGCWICSLRAEDKTLNKLGEKEAYIKKMESFRNELMESVSYNMGSWSNRDFYIHGKFIEKVYNKGKSYRMGMRVAGGYSLSYRKEMFGKLLELERDIYHDRGAYLIDDAELAYIQELWIEEGDMELSVFKMAYHRKFTISSKHLDILEALLIYKENFYKSTNFNSLVWVAPCWEAYTINKNVNERYFAQLSKEVIEQGRCAIFTAKALTKTLKSATDDEVVFCESMNFIEGFKVNTKQFYPNGLEIESIRSEWKNDEISLVTLLKRIESGEVSKPNKLLFGYEGEFSKLFEQLDEVEEKGDITLCESVSLIDKMRMMEEW